VLVPTAVAATGTPPVPTPGAHDVDDYQCRSVKVRRGSAGIPSGLTLALGEPLTTPAARFEVKRPTRLCSPSAIGGQSIKHPARHLACYRVRTAAREPRRGTPLVISNALGTGRFHVRGAQEVCLPSTIETP
jgi:hypothetical protein